MPAQKKHPTVRARTNRASTAATLSATPRIGRAPSLPSVVSAKGEEREWCDLTRAWWADIWRSPMSAEYHSSDRHQIVVLAVLMDDFFTASSPSARKMLSEEIRQHRTAFGMTPYDRRRLEWTIEQAEDAKDKGSARRTRQGTVQPKSADDPRRAFQVVS